MKKRIKEEFVRLENASKRAVIDAERQVEEEAKRKRREQARLLAEETSRIKAAEPVKIDMKGFSMGSKLKTNKSSGIFFLFFNLQ